MTTKNLVRSKLHSMTIITALLCLLCCSKLHASEHNTFNVEVKGQGQEIILIPGLMSNASVFDSVVNALLPQYEVHLVSIKGFANTPASGNFSIANLVQDLVSYIDENDLQKPDVIGHSLGGLTGFVLASYHQDKIGKLISIDGLPFIGPIFTRNSSITADMMLAQAKNIKTMYANMTSEQLAAQTQQGVFIQATSSQDQNRIVEMAKQSNPETVGNAMYDVLTTDMRQPLAQSNTNILMLGASGGYSQQAQHKMVSSLYSQQFENVKNATVVMNTTTRHFMFFDDATWVNQQITQFLGE
ncbi:MAG: alpha/beta hydrolase [Aliiglaciecola sp.]|uniref:alpha/beta fold hydrolase n=1 Tax=Aliiglaciecola sp. TaxID=1872441 RepID=UPI0032996E67